LTRELVELASRLERLSILDENAEVDKELEPDLADQLLLDLHRNMLLARRFDERLLKLQRQGRIGTFAPVAGQEASQIGAVACLEKDDWLVPAFRETAAAIWRGLPLVGLLLYNAGYNEGGAVPEDQFTLPIAVPVGTQVPHAVGIAYALKLQEKENIAMTFFGDGATSEGDFHEAMNFAQVFGTPTIFVCQNNQWAISVPREQQTKSKTLAQKALAYGMPGLQVDGNDVLAVYVATREAVDRARSGDGPTMLECVTYRMEVHTTADDPSRYREEKDVERWRERDPIDRFQKYLTEKDLLSDAEIDNLEKKIASEIDEAWDEAAGRMEDLGDPIDMFDHVYAEPPQYLREQRRTLSSDSTNDGD